MNSLLVVIDYQNDFVSGSLGFKDAEEIYPKLLNRIKTAEKNKEDIIFTRDTHEENYLETVEGKYLPVKHCIKNTEGWKFYKDLEEISSSHLVLEKDTFPCLKLTEVLKDKKYDEITICGVVTNICVISNAVILKAIYPNAKICVDSSLSASNDKELEAKSYDILRNLHIEVI